MKITYIAGNGHSGSTMLDMMLGKGKSCFSAGELCFITRKGILKEYCSCGDEVGECEVWQSISSTWCANSPISWSRYSELRLGFERTRSIFRVVLNLLSPSEEFHQYCKATKILFEAIQAETGSDEVVDSSKSVSRILILRQFSELTVIHLCRNFTGVLNSFRKFHPKDLANGIETDLHPMPVHRVLSIWITTNLLTYIVCLGTDVRRIQYFDLVNAPRNVLRSLGRTVDRDHPVRISADHMLAGNALRLSKHVEIDPEVGFRYTNLTRRQLLLGRLVDSLFWFWAKR